MIGLRVSARGLVMKDGVGGRFGSSIRQAIREGLNEGGDKVRTDVRKALQQQTGAKTYRAITSRTRSIKAGGALQYVIIGSGKGLPIKEFRTQIRRGTGGGVVSEPWNVSRQFQRSFALKGQGADGYRARTTSKRFPVRKLFGPSIPKEMMQGAIPSVFVLSVGAQVLPAIEKRLVRALRIG